VESKGAMAYESYKSSVTEVTIATLSLFVLTSNPKKDGVSDGGNTEFKSLSLPVFSRPVSLGRCAEIACLSIDTRNFAMQNQSGEITCLLSTR